MESIKLAVLQGDQTGQELLEQALRILDAKVIGLDIEMTSFDLSLENRRSTKNRVVHEAAAALKQHGLGIKAATITPETANDVGSPNAILREQIGGKVIVRTGRRLPGILPVGGVSAPISVVRMAVDDAYNAREWREGEGLKETAYRTEHISRDTCKLVAEFSFRHAKKMGARVFGGPKYTVSPIYEGMLKEELDAAAERHPDVRYEPQLIDATYALLFSRGADPLVIPSLNRDGDCLSDLVLALYGSVAGSESVLLAFDDDLVPDVVMTEAPHGTAPALFGKNIANPLAMILAAASVLSYARQPAAIQASRAIYEAALECVYEGSRTTDLGGSATTSEFTDAVIRRVRSKLEAWQSLGEATR